MASRIVGAICYFDAKWNQTLKLIHPLFFPFNSDSEGFIRVRMGMDEFKDLYFYIVHTVIGFIEMYPHICGFLSFVCGWCIGPGYKTVSA